MAFKLILLSAVLLLSAPLLWFLTRRRIYSVSFRVGLLTIWLAGLLVCYPAVTYTWAMLKIDHVYDSDCATAVQLSRRYLKLPYFQFQINLIGVVTGATPKFYYLSTIALCQNKMGYTKAAVKTMKELKNYCLTSPYDKDEFELTSKALERLQQELKKSDTKSENK